MNDNFLILSFKNLFYSSVKKEAFFSTVKETLEFKDICNLIDELSTKAPFATKYIYGNPIPKSYEELGIGSKLRTGSAFEKELNWFFIIVRKYYPELNKFLSYKSQYEKYLLLGLYAEAENIIDTIDKEICVSLWGIENRLLIKEHKDGIEENKNFLNEINSKARGFYITSLIHFLSIRAEKDLSVNRYNSSLLSSLNNLSGSLKEEHLNYYFFKLSYFQFEKFSKLNYINCFDSYHSIIDRYLSFIRLTQTIIINGDEDISYLASRINYIRKKVKDPLIERLHIYFNPSSDIETNNDQLETIKILDLYTKGDYESAIGLIKSHLLKDPLCFELYEIYCKCLLNLNKDFLTFAPESFLQNTILKNIYKILSKGPETQIAEIDLIKITYNLGSTNIAYQLFDFILRETRSINRFNKIAALNSKFYNPNFCKVYDTNELSDQYLNNLFKYNSNSETIQFLRKVINNDLSEINFKIPNSRKKTYEALYYQSEREYDNAIAIWLDVKKECKNIPHLYERIIFNLYECYLLKGDFEKCVVLYVESFFENQFFTLKLDHDKVKSEIKKYKFKNININIYIPIFYFISNSDDYETHTATETYLNSLSLTKPSELLLLDDTLENSKYVNFFLANVCTPEILKHSIFINGTRERLNERILICQFLSSHIPESSEIYNQEIDSITKKLIIQEGIQELDESKIYINENGIIHSELKDLEGVFKRYLSLSELKNKKDIKILALSPEGQLVVSSISSEDANTKGEIPKFSKDPLYDLFKDMFVEIRDKFLFGKFGLVAYLSTRIRHGVFLGEIRPQFERSKLITQKNINNNIYIKNDYWDTQLSGWADETKEKVQRVLSGFSHNIDDLIQNIVKNYLQIKTEKYNPQGWFDYIFDDVTLSVAYAYYYKDTNTLSDFTRQVFIQLWGRTDENLELIRSKLKNEIKAEFTRLLTELERDLTTLISKKLLPELYNNIVNSTTNVQNDLDRIAGWFNRSDSQISDFKIDKAVEISLEYSNKISLIKKLAPHIQIDCSLIFKGEYYLHFVDLIRIFLDNILHHSGSETTDDIISKIVITHANNILNIKISNSLSNKIDISQFKQQVEKQKEKFSENIYIKQSQTEGGSGFYKAKKILSSDLKSESNKINIFISDDKMFNAELFIKTEKLMI